MDNREPSCDDHGVAPTPLPSPGEDPAAAAGATSPPLAWQDVDLRRGCGGDTSVNADAVDDDDYNDDDSDGDSGDGDGDGDGDYRTFFLNKIVSMTLIATLHRRLWECSWDEINKVKVVLTLYFNAVSLVFRNSAIN